MKNEDNGMSPDIAENGVHPTDKGYTILKEIVLEALSATGSAKQ